VLVELLAGGSSVADALPALAARRESRVRWVQNQSRRIGRIGQLENPILCGLRDGVLRMVPDRASANALRKLADQSI